MENKTLVSDFYEFTMSDIYSKTDDIDTYACFEVFSRSNVFDGGYQIAAGLEEVIDYIENFHFDESDIDFLKSTNKLSADFVDYLRNLRFTGDIWAIPDGTPIFPNEPVMTIRASIIEAQIIETALLASYNSGVLTATAAKRSVEAAKGIDISEFGSRRVRGGILSTLLHSKYAYMGGCSATSNTRAGKDSDINVGGTMGHSYIQKHKDEYTAFLNYAKYTEQPDNIILLVDTYDVELGIMNAIRLQKEYLDPRGLKLHGIRIDSGDLVYLTKMAKKMFVKAGMDYVKISVSNGLDAIEIERLLNEGAIIDSLGVGDNIVAPRERANFVYKLVEVIINGIINRTIKISEDTIKVLNPGHKRVYRFYDKQTNKALGDVLALYDEIIPKDSYTLVDHNNPWKKTNLTDYTVKELQVPIFQNGKLVYEMPSLEKRRLYVNEQYATLTDRITTLHNPHTYYVDLSDKARELKMNMIEEIQARTEEQKKIYRKKYGSYFEAS